MCSCYILRWARIFPRFQVEMAAEGVRTVGTDKRWMATIGVWRCSLLPSRISLASFLVQRPCAPHVQSLHMAKLLSLNPHFFFLFAFARGPLRCTHWTGCLGESSLARLRWFCFGNASVRQPMLGFSVFYITKALPHSHLRAEYVCLNPSVAFSDLTQLTRTVVLTSGTLSPTSMFCMRAGAIQLLLPCRLLCEVRGWPGSKSELDLTEFLFAQSSRQCRPYIPSLVSLIAASFASELGIPFPNVLEANHIVPPEQVCGVARVPDRNSARTHPAHA